MSQFLHVLELSVSKDLHWLLIKKKKKVNICNKSNAQRHGMVMWDDVFDKLGMNTVILRLIAC